MARYSIEFVRRIVRYLIELLEANVRKCKVSD